MFSILHVLPIVWLIANVAALVLTVLALASKADAGSKFAVVLSALTTLPGAAFPLEASLTVPGPAPVYVTQTLVLIWCLVGPLLMVVSALVLPFERNGQSFVLVRSVNAAAWLVSTFVVMASA